MDLSVDMGIPGLVAHPKMVAAIERLIDVSDRLGVAPGMIHPDLDVLESWIGRGMRFVSHATDSILLERAARDAAARLRAMRRRGKSGAAVARSPDEAAAP
jgi:2-keto-3-deoxy-L-rhamnonate aldolase RhmA